MIPFYKDQAIFQSTDNFAKTLIECDRDADDLTDDDKFKASIYQCNEDLKVLKNRMKRRKTISKTN